MLSLSQISKLREPFKAGQIKHKPQTQPKQRQDKSWPEDGWGTVIFYLDSRDVAERLDAGTGGDWSDDYSLFGKALECSLTVCGITRKDVGEGDKAKELYSDAFKRAAVKFGVGAFLYRLPNIMCKMENKGKNGTARYELTEKAKLSVAKMKQLAEAGEWEEQAKFPDLMILSGFQASEDFSEPEDGPFSKEQMEEVRQGANRIIKEREAAESVSVEQNVIVKHPTRKAAPLDAPMAGRGSYDPASDTYRDTLLPEGEPESPEHNEDEIPQFEPSPFAGKAQAAKKALGLPAEQRPVQASSGDGPITQEQRKKLMAVLSSFSVKEKGDVMGFLSFLLKRELTSSTEISSIEARSIINEGEGGRLGESIQNWREAA